MHRHGRIIDNIKCFRMTVNDNSIGCFFIKIFSLPTPKLLLVLQINWFDAFDQATTDRDDCCHPVFKASKLFYFLLIILSHISFHFWGLQRCFLIKDRGKGRKTTLIGGGGGGGEPPWKFSRPIRIRRYFEICWLLLTFEKKICLFPTPQIYEQKTTARLFINKKKKITRASFTDALYSSGGDLWLNAKKKIRRPNLYLAFALWASPGNKDPTPEQGFAFVTGLMIKRYFSQQFETCLPRLPLELARPFCLFLQNPCVQQPYLLVCFWYDRFSLFFQDRFCVFLLTVHTLHDGSIGTSMPL